MSDAPYDKGYAKRNKDRVAFWDRFDSLPKEAKELLDHPDECVSPTMGNLLIAEELSGIVYPEIPQTLNAKQRNWLARQNKKAQEAAAYNARMRKQFPQLFKPVKITQQEMVVLRERKLTEAEEKQRKLHKVLGLTKKANIKLSYLQND